MSVVADAAVANVHDLPAEASALLSSAAEVEDFKLDHMLLALRSSEQKRFGLPLNGYAVDSRGHVTGAQHP
jgi:hypothetical protein